MIKYENMRGSTIEGVSKDRHGRDIKCTECIHPVGWFCIEYKERKVFYYGVEDAGDFIELLKRAK